MSTRCQIEFIYKWKTTSGQYRSEKRTVYRHSDGYPGSMIPDLLEFIQWNQGRNDQVDYMAANWIYWNKRREEDAWLNDANHKRWEKRTGNISWNDPAIRADPNHFLKTGHGIDINNRYHGDIEYLYKVIVVESGFGGVDVISIVAHAVDMDGGWDAKHTFTKFGDVMFRYDMTDDEIAAEGKRIAALDRNLKGDE